MRVSSTYTYNAHTREARRTTGDISSQIEYIALSRGDGLLLLRRPGCLPLLLLTTIL